MTKGRPWTVRRMMVLIALLSVPIAGLTLLARGAMSAREVARSAQCRGNLKQIALALYNYAEVYGALPPAYTTDPTGRPLLSWRVLILPFLQQQAIYAHFHLDEPWDGPNNGLLLDEMPMTYACPTHQPGVTWTSPGRFTSYLATSGPGTALPGPDAVPFSRFLDGLDETLLVVESDQANVPWTAPIDLDVRTGGLVHFNAPQTVPRGPTTPHPSGLNSLAADGSAFRLDPEKLRQALGAVSTIAGGEPTKLDDLRPAHR